MKKWLVLIIAIAFVAGCGSNDQQAFKGVTKKKDYVAEGFKQLQEKDIARAIRNFDLAIKQEPTNVENYLTLGQVYLRLKNVDRAVDTLSAGLKVAPDNGDINYMLATCYAFKGDIEKAQTFAKKSADIYMKKRDSEKFKQSVALVRSLSPNPAAAAGDKMDKMKSEVASDIKKTDLDLPAEIQE